jgi:hypothetical protein
MRIRIQLFTLIGTDLYTDPAPHQSDANLRPVVYRPVVSIGGPPWLHFEPLKLLSLDLNADPDPAFHSNSDPAKGFFKMGAH